MEQVVIYTDGAYNKVKNKYGCGVVYDVEGNKSEYSFGGNDQLICRSQSVAGELIAVMFAVKKAIKDGFKKIDLYHDNEGIRKWVTGEFAARKTITHKYAEFMLNAKQYAEIEFHNVAAHTGVKYNVLADQLARMGADLDAKRA